VIKVLGENKKKGKKSILSAERFEEMDWDNSGRVTFKVVPRRCCLSRHQTHLFVAIRRILELDGIL
jgi:hypothetical protein